MGVDRAESGLLKISDGEPTSTCSKEATSEGSPTQVAHHAAKLAERGVISDGTAREVEQDLAELEQKLSQKTSDAEESVPRLDLNLASAGLEEFFPLFERFEREDLEGREGPKKETVNLPPVDERLPEKVADFAGAADVLRRTDVLLAKL